jgi:two-component system, chemotaxis family, response regulator Rcp1
MPKTLRIWLVDDDADEQTLVQHVMAKLPVGVELRWFEQAATAIDVLESSDASRWPQLIICDVKMPGMDGFGFLDWVRHSRWKALPVVLCSNSSERGDVTRAYALGANAYHVKARTLDGMRECFEMLTAYWSETVELPRVPNMPYLAIPQENARSAS